MTKNTLSTEQKEIITKTIRDSINRKLSPVFADCLPFPSSTRMESNIIIPNDELVCEGFINEGTLNSVYRYHLKSDESQKFAVKWSLAENDHVKQRIINELMIQQILTMKQKNILPVVIQSPLEEFKQAKLPCKAFSVTPFGVDCEKLFSNKSSAIIHFTKIDELSIAHEVFDHIRLLVTDENFPVCHRDVKPSNIIAIRSNTYSREIRLLLTDFNISVVKPKPDFTCGIGTPYWCDPDFIREDKDVRRLCDKSKYDTYSAALTVLSLLTNEGRVFTQTAPDVPHKQFIEEYTVRLQSECLRKIIENSIKNEPNDRPSVVDVVDEIEKEILRLIEGAVIS